MKNFYLDFEMCKEDGKVINLLMEIEQYERTQEITNEVIGNIYVDSNGGENRMTSILYDFFKKANNRYSFTLGGDLSSNAILLLLALNPKNLTILRQCSSIIHLSSYTPQAVSLIFNDSKGLYFNAMTEYNGYLTNLLELYKMFSLSKEELNHIKSGGDVFLSAQRILDIFNKLSKSKVMQKKARNIFEITL